MLILDLIFDRLFKMECSNGGYVTFLMCCNVALMLVGVSVLVLGMKMEQLLSALLLLSVPLIGQAVKAVIATGVFISFTGLTGIAGACNQAPFLIKMHLFALGVIVIMEFGIGVTLLVVRKTIEDYIGTLECNTNCASTLDALVLDYALPSAGLMLTIIIVEAVMMYSALKVLSHLRECHKIIEPGTNDMVHDVQMQSVASPYPRFSPHPDRTFMISPHTRYPPLNSSPHLSFLSSPQPWYTPEPDYMQHQALPSPFARSPHLSAAASKPPQYESLPPHLQLPPPAYVEAVPEPSAGSFAPPQTPLKRDRSGSCNSV